MDDDGHERRGVDLVSGPAVHLDVAESMEGERRLPCLGPDAPQDVLVGRLGVAEGANPKLPVLHHLGVAEGDRRADRAFDGESHPAHQVLAEVEDGLSQME